MIDQRHHGKINNIKILRWRLELRQYNFDICHKPGVEHVARLHLLRFRGCVVLRLESLSSNYTNLLVTQAMLVFITSFVSIIYLSQVQKLNRVQKLSYLR